MAGVDLFGWRELKAAETAVEAARDRQAQARRKALYAPHGEKVRRQAALLAATTETLRLEADLAALHREAGL